MNRKNPNRAWAAALLAGLLLSAAAAAQRGEPLFLEADQAEMSQQTGVGVYTGNVVLTRGEMQITGDRMTVHTTDARDLERVIVEGDLATFQQRRPNEQPIRGRAPRMEYHAGEGERIVLLGGATVWQGKNEFSGQRIDYDLAAERVTARGEGERRTRITFFPREGNGGGDTP